MSLLVTGSVGIDTVVTPHGQAAGVLGGSAVYFSFVASYFTRVRVVAVVGEDFPDEYRQLWASRDVDLSGLETRRGSETFRWTGRYAGEMNVAETLEVDLNVLAEHGPRVPDAFADSKFVFLANTHPTLQRDLLVGVRAPQLVVCDTMNLWIVEERDSLIETLRLTTGVIVNDAEARMLTQRTNLIEAGEAILDLGPKFVMIKKGEHGAFLVSTAGNAALPGYPTKDVVDPTGAGDSFAGGVMGYLAARGLWDLDALRNAMVRGVVAASFTIEDFSLRRLLALTMEELNARLERYMSMLRLT